MGHKATIVQDRKKPKRVSRATPLLRTATLLILAWSACVPAARAEVLKFVATLDAKSEVPANVSLATGQAEFLYNTDTAQLTYTVVYDGLTGPATAGHIHGPAAPGSNAGIVVPFPVPASPISGTATLLPAQAEALLAALLYVNIHTAANPTGEIRGQITK